jgi:hypothetical protein
VNVFKVNFLDYAQRSADGTALMVARGGLLDAIAGRGSDTGGGDGGGRGGFMDAVAAAVGVSPWRWKWWFDGGGHT